MLQDAVAVVGYPIGGDTISVTSGVVSRIEVTSYVHGSTELLGVQIDAAINSGNSGGQMYPMPWLCLRCNQDDYPQNVPVQINRRVHINVCGCVAGGPVFNEIGQCVGIAFQSMAGSDAENIGYVIPTPVINHFLTDYQCVSMKLSPRGKADHGI